MRELVALIERFRPGFGSTIEAATSVVIEDLEEAAGPLPGSYRRFLATMGRTLGDLVVHDMNFNALDMLLAYQLEPRAIRDRYLRIAGDRGSTGLSYYLDRGSPHGADDCALVVMSGDPAVGRDQSDPLHVGLEELLYVEAYRTLRMPMLPHHVELIASPLQDDPRCTADHVCAAASSLGFVRTAPVRRCALFERGDAAIVLYRHPLWERFSLRVGADDPAALARAIAVIRQASGVEIFGARPSPM